MRCFIAYVLKGAEAKATDKLRASLGRAFGVEAASRIVPHVTLVPPFEVDDPALLKDDLASIARSTPAFTVAADGFGYFGDRVWYVDLDQVPPLCALKEAAEAVVRWHAVRLMGHRPGNETHFHVTLAYKDVTPALFLEIGDFLQGTEQPFRELHIDHIALMRRGARRGNRTSVGSSRGDAVRRGILSLV